MDQIKRTIGLVDVTHNTPHFLWLGIPPTRDMSSATGYMFWRYAQICKMVSPREETLSVLHGTNPCGQHFEARVNAIYHFFYGY